MCKIHTNTGLKTRKENELKWKALKTIMKIFISS